MIFLRPKEHFDPFQMTLIQFRNFIFLKFPIRKSFLKNSRAQLATRVCVFLSNKPMSSGHFVMNTVRVSTVI